MYIGSYEVKEEKPFTYKSKTATGEKTSFDYVEVSFNPATDKEGKELEIENQIFAKDTLESLKTDEPMDHNFVKEKKLLPAAYEILKTLLKHNISIMQIQDVTTIVSNQLEKSLDRADEKLWGKSKYTKSILDADRVLRK
jgi:hypothetical protein